LNHQIDETFRRRDRGPKERAKWEAACAKFHKSFNDLFYPGGGELLDKLRTGNPEAVESAIRYLIADPRHFRSGYVKEYLWRMAPRMKLVAGDIERLENAAIAYLHRQISREFWYMCRAMARMGTSDLWRKVTQQLAAEDSLVAKRASYLLAFSVDVNAGVKVQKQVYRDVLHEKYGQA
jgi:hypothetical protein